MHFAWTAILALGLAAACAGPGTSPTRADTRAGAQTRSIDSAAKGNVPRDIDEAFAALDRLLSAEDRRLFAADSMSVIEAHFGLGMWMRNNWGLWGGSPLARYFNDRGICHPDDMSSIILRSYWRRLNSRPQEVQAQVADARAYWRARGAPDSCTADER